MKTIYFIYAMLFKKISVIQIFDDDSFNAETRWAAHDKPQDGMGGHNGEWREGSTAIDAVWELRKAN